MPCKFKFLLLRSGVGDVGGEERGHDDGAALREGKEIGKVDGGEGRFAGGEDKGATLFEGNARGACHEVIINAVRNARCCGHAAGRNHHAEGVVRSRGGRGGEVVVIKMHDARICGQRGTS